MAFERIKEAVDIVEVAQRFGVQVERGRARCFVHDDKTPSLFFRDGRYKCFGCGASGDVFDLVAAVEGVPLLEAARRIDDMYGLGLLRGGGRSPPDPRRLHRTAERARVQAFEQWVLGAGRRVADWCRTLEAWRQTHAPATPAELDAPHPRWAACHDLAYWDWVYHTVFIGRDFRAQLALFYSKEIDDYGRKIDDLAKG